MLSGVINIKNLTEVELLRESDQHPHVIRYFCMVSFTFADREVELLRESDRHPHVIRYYKHKKLIGSYTSIYRRSGISSMIVRNSVLI
jgi:uncharacterized protein YwbE